MKIEIVDQTEENTDKEDLYHGDHDLWIATKVAEMGFSIAGFIEEIYEDAVILLPPIFRFDWKKENVLYGRILSIQWNEFTISFVLLTENGVQVPKTYGPGHNIFFALPENTRDFCVAKKIDVFTANTSQEITEATITRIPAKISTSRASLGK